ncbi:FkbM family methyltransferase [Streptomyces sp. HUCO-GS316]|uniref:FkbM family methyltransferase n=1 Tax=Streptomyces sp. HUCO-GS316 TaxID=2692198 RepID=UPI00136DDDAB|nr:FkbM family methyltransferase [Streptomyces sp. HUCO-GS316]MXM63469.1 FkbM family methyltransferase [Streptomyces sp. HUCO-GS316]
MRIFLDVGGHYGEALDVALDPRWGFERIYSFEPARHCQRILRGFRDSRVQVVPAGLSSRSGEATLFGTGLLGASVYADKDQAGDRVESETIALLRATEWLLANTSERDEIYLKLNCEGSECDVLEDMLDSGVIGRLRSIYVDFDVRKIPSQAHRRATVEERLRQHRQQFVTPESLADPAGSAAVREWLSLAGPQSPVARGALRYRLGLHLPPYIWASRAAKAALPRPAYSLAARHLGAQSRRRTDR